MRVVAAAAVLTAAGAAAADNGSIAGSVPMVKLSVGSQVEGYDRVVVYLADDPVAPDGAATSAAYSIVQDGKAFRPSLLVVPVGATVEFPNRDVVSHNVFSLATDNEFDLGLYKKGASKSFTFAHPGVVPVFCNIHPQMIAHVVVTPGPHHTQPDAEGNFVIPDVPPGTYTVVAWYPFGEPTTASVTVTAGKRASVKLTLRERRAAGRHKNKHDKPYTRY